MDVHMRNGFLLGIAALIAVIHFWSPKLWAQEEEGADNSFDVDQIEAELAQRREQDPAMENQLDKNEKLEGFSGLGTLAPFSEVSVIQRRFLPKTGRFQLFGGLTSVVNDPWFSGFGFDGRFAYHFTEAWGIELTSVFLSNSQRQAIKDLYDQHGVKTDSIITAKNYYGASLVWTPIYGKMGLFNQRIVPFDMYFSLGGGTTGVDGGDGGGTLHFGTGQIFAVTKAVGLRWDFTWNAFSATPVGQSPQNFNNLLLSFGASFFFPEANYR